MRPYGGTSEEAAHRRRWVLSGLQDHRRSEEVTARITSNTVLHISPIRLHSPLGCIYLDPTFISITSSIMEQCFRSLKGQFNILETKRGWT